MWREYGLTLVMVTHDSTVARRAQRIGLMRSGQIEIRPGGSQREVDGGSKVTANI
jgi:ABC-type lipoprotein export system ATPase subunit